MSGFGATDRVAAAIDGVARWAGRAGDSAGLAWRRRDLWPVALAGFLVRGGVVPLLLPILILPSPIQIAGTVLVDAISITGQLTTQAIVAIVVAAVAAFAWLVAAGTFGALVDATLVRAGRAEHGAGLAERGAGGAERGAGDAERGAGDARSAHVVEQLTIRGALLIPVLVVVAYAAFVVVQTAYAELSVPSTLATPLVARIVSRTMPALVAVAIVWLIAEALGAIAVRYELRDGSGAFAALGATARHIATRPVTTLLTVAVALGVTVAAVGIPLLAAAAAFDWSRVVARGGPITFTIGVQGFSTTRDARTLLVFVSAAALAAAWLAALVAAAATSAWRSFLFTAEVPGNAAVRGNAEVPASPQLPAELPATQTE